MMTWKIESVSCVDGVIDIDCIDNSAKGSLRSWRMTIDCDAGTVYGVLRRSENVEAWFGDGVDLPRRMVSLIFRDLIMPQHWA
jgi:hypothetical protein